MINSFPKNCIKPQAEDFNRECALFSVNSLANPPLGLAGGCTL